MECSDDKIGIRNWLIDGGQRVSNGLCLLEICINSLGALVEIEKLKLETCGTGSRLLSKMARQTVPDGFGSVESNGLGIVVAGEALVAGVVMMVAGSGMVPST